MPRLPPPPPRHFIGPPPTPPTPPLLQVRDAKQAEQEFAAECERLDREFAQERQRLQVCHMAGQVWHMEGPWQRQLADVGGGSGASVNLHVQWLLLCNNQHR